MACSLLEMKKKSAIKRQRLLNNFFKNNFDHPSLKALSSNLGSPKFMIVHLKSKTFSAF